MLQSFFPGSRYRQWGAFGVLIVCLVMGPAFAWAGPTVLMVLSEEGKPYREVWQGVQSALDRSADRVASMDVVVLSEQGLSFSPLTSGGPDLVVAVGAKAFQAAVGASSTIPVLGLLVPRQTYEVIVRRPAGDMKSSIHSAIYIDQPVSRQLRLIKELLPGKTRVGLITSPFTRPIVIEARRAGQRLGLKVISETIDFSEDLVPALRKVLIETDALVVIPDPVVANRNTLHALLLTTYRHHDPVVGYSEAYVRAGALAAVYTTPAQTGREAGELVVRWARAKPRSLPPPRYASSFSVALNHEVARSLGLHLPPEESIERKLVRATENDE